MKKIILAALVVASLFASCSSEKTFKKKDGSTITAKPYGWASKENKVEGVNYELNAPDVVAKNHSIWLAVDYDGIEKAFFGINQKDVINMESGGVIRWFFRMEALRSSSEENCLGAMSR